MSTTAETTERPIIMSAESVRAILEGRKSQARRVVEFQGSHEQDNPCCQGLVQYWPGKWGWHFHNPDNEGEYKRKYFPKGMVEQAGHRCPYGRVGDVLWAREAFRLPRSKEGMSPSSYVLENKKDGLAPPIQYVADGKEIGRAIKAMKWGRKRPPEDMPRKLCRLRLRVEEVRVERVKGISEEDARAEGITDEQATDSLLKRSVDDSGSPWRRAYAALWDDINGERDGGAYAWERDPWCWRVMFSRIEE